VLSLPAAVRIFLCLEPADMRRSFDGLARMTQEILREDPLSGHLFVFRNRRGDRLKVLWWDRDGFALFYKRLEAGSFVFPLGEGQRLCVTAAELASILEGIDLSQARRFPRYERKGNIGLDTARRSEVIYGPS